MNITYLASFQLEVNYPMWERVMKINLFMFVISGTILNRKNIDQVIWALVLALGLLGAKGLFTIAHGGAYIVWGPGGFVGGNNEFALALVMIIPLMYYLRIVSENRWIKHALLAMMFLCTIAALGSHYPGALLAMGAMSVMLIAKSKQRTALSLLAIVIVAFVFLGMPMEWFERMSTITSYQEDRSAMGRINAWTMAFNLALDKFFGSSFENVNFEYFSRYGLDSEYIQGPHSIYFEVLGQHGFVGLFLLLRYWNFSLALCREGDQTQRWKNDAGCARCDARSDGKSIIRCFCRWWRVSWVGVLRLALLPDAGNRKT